MAGFKSKKKGSNIICRVSNATPNKVCEYVHRLPKQKMTNEAFHKYMGEKWFDNEHQAPEQWGLYYIDDEYYYPRFNRDITIDEAERYLYGWMKRLIVINPYTRFKVTNDSRLVESIVKQLEVNPDERDLKTIIRNIINSDEPFIVNDIIANALNNYSEVLKVQVLDKDDEKFTVSLLPNYKEILKTKFNMTKKEYFDSFNDINISAPLNEPNQIIFFGAPGTGKSQAILRRTKGYNAIRTTFHPDSDYSTFVGCYKPTTDPVYDKNGHPTTEEKITYSYSEQAFLQAYLNAWKAMEDPEPKPQFLIIEEINRGNCAQIFGDLFQLLDRKNGYSEYPIDADSDLQKQLAKKFKPITIAKEIEDEINAMYREHYPDGIVKKIKDGELLLLPKNLYIWATMNTSDQSLFPIDSAFKRRWQWRYVKISKGIDETTKQPLNWTIEFDYKEKEVVKHYSKDWWEFIKAINDKIAAADSSDDKKLGYFFCKPTMGTSIDAETFVSKVIFYLWSDVFKDNDNELFHIEGEPSFDIFYKEDEEGNTVVDTNVLYQFMQKVFDGKIEAVEDEQEPTSEDE